MSLDIGNKKTDPSGMGNEQGKRCLATTWRKILGCAQGTVLEKKQLHRENSGDLKISST